MKFWWVNQGQTFREERKGGYLWSPKRKKAASGAITARNPFYEYMREVAPGDMVFSYVSGQIVSCGVITSFCYESPRPDEFGKIGRRWDLIGWRVDVRYIDPVPFKPKDWIDRIRIFLLDKHAPLNIEGKGKELYLTTIAAGFADILILGLGAIASDCRAQAAALHKHETTDAFADKVHEDVELVIEEGIKSDGNIPATEKETIVRARIGQGDFRDAVARVEGACRITGVVDRDHLVASHIKPWRDSDNRERLDKYNGLMLTPTPDHLFDRGFISFEDDGHLVYATRVNRAALHLMKIPEEGFNAGRFSIGQLSYLKYHREMIFKRAL
jgi:hypothetical protein